MESKVDFMHGVILGFISMIGLGAIMTGLVINDNTQVLGGIVIGVAGIAMIFYNFLFNKEDYSAYEMTDEDVVEEE